jgi:hypothetical protein
MTDQADAMIEARAKELGIPIDKRWAAEIKTQLEVSLLHAAAIAEFPLSDDTEPAPVFKA